jgi:hypothetical protein
VLYAGQSRAGANRTHGVYDIRTAYKPYSTFSTISYFYGQPYSTIPYSIVITEVRTVRFILLATLGDIDNDDDNDHDEGQGGVRGGEGEGGRDGAAGRGSIDLDIAD